MYDLPELREAHDALWGSLAVALESAGETPPEHLTWGVDAHTLWRSPRLYLTQSCGYPLATKLRDKVTVLGTFAYDVPNARAATVASVLVARPEFANVQLRELNRLRAAVNSLDSLSGWVSLLVSVAGVGNGWAGSVRLTGSHEASLHEIANGRADVASIDGVTFELLRRQRPSLLESVLVVGAGPRVPCLPLVTSARVPDGRVEAFRSALSAAMVDPALTDHLATLCIGGFEPLDVEAYDHLAALAPPR